jgi:NADP-dependent 3-hydroxy acid dehydrogenase YdfG
MGPLERRVIIVTGGSRGIGAAMSRLFADEGPTSSSPKSAMIWGRASSPRFRALEAMLSTSTWT